MIAQYHKLALTIGFALAMAFTFSCSGDGGGGDNNPSTGISSSSDNGGSSSSGGNSSGGSSSSSDVSSSSSEQSSSSVEIPKCGTLEYNPETHLCDLREQRLYKFVPIGEQTWMAENLNYAVQGSKCYGESGTVKVGENIITLLPAEIQDNCIKYGRLYNWVAAMSGCPSGWRLPNNDDWNALMKSANPSCSDVSTPCIGAGTKLKATSGWDDFNGSSGNGDNASGFSAMPGGYGNEAYQFVKAGELGYWWSFSDEEGKAYSLGMGNLSDAAAMSNYDKGSLRSVRCLKNTP